MTAKSPRALYSEIPRCPDPQTEQNRTEPIFVFIMGVYNNYQGIHTHRPGPEKGYKILGLIFSSPRQRRSL